MRLSERQSLNSRGTLRGLLYLISPGRRAIEDLLVRRRYHNTCLILHRLNNMPIKVRASGRMMATTIRHRIHLGPSRAHHSPRPRLHIRFQMHPCHRFLRYCQRLNSSSARGCHWVLLHRPAKDPPRTLLSLCLLHPSRKRPRVSEAAQEGVVWVLATRTAHMPLVMRYRLAYQIPTGMSRAILAMRPGRVDPKMSQDSVVIQGLLTRPFLFDKRVSVRGRSRP